MKYSNMAIIRLAIVQPNPPPPHPHPKITLKLKISNLHVCVQLAYKEIYYLTLKKVDKLSYLLGKCPFDVELVITLVVCNR